MRLETSRSDIPSLKCIRLILANIPTLITPCSPALFLSGQVNHGGSVLRENYLPKWVSSGWTSTAKYTFEQLPRDKQAQVEKKTHEILARLMMRPPTEFQAEVHRFGWYALAMAELGISPALEEDKWSHVSNPFFAVLPGHSSFGVICEYMKRKHRVAISIDDKPCSPWPSKMPND